MVDPGKWHEIRGESSIHILSNLAISQSLADC